MSATLNFDLDRINKLLETLPVIERSPALEKGFKRATDVVKRHQAAAAPRASEGRPVLATSITRRIANFPERVVAYVGPHPRIVYARPVEEGHRIVVAHGPRKGQDTGRKTTPQPFVGPSIDAVGQQAASMIADEVEKEVQRIVGL